MYITLWNRRWNMCTYVYSRYFLPYSFIITLKETSMQYLSISILLTAFSVGIGSHKYSKSFHLVGKRYIYSFDGLHVISLMFVVKSVPNNQFLTMSNPFRNLMQCNVTPAHTAMAITPIFLSLFGERAARTTLTAAERDYKSQQTFHTSPSRASYGMCIVMIGDKIDRFITASHCILAVLHKPK